jgi:hypothetical protein
MERWLDCRISPGQFTGEFAVQGEMSNSKGFSLFLDGKFLKFESQPGPDAPVKGSIRIRQLDAQGDKVLVELPQPTFENGQTITVKADQIR